LIAGAWRASASGEVGYPAVKVADVEAGKLDPFDALFGAD
ncbi:MAG: S1/P1 Nuclease, partial [Caulobacteraceae bacterium]|nr:S1/P1 Nuclease [Caulobacteraceae bacterium]